MTADVSRQKTQKFMPSNGSPVRQTHFKNRLKLRRAEPQAPVGPMSTIKHTQLCILWVSDGDVDPINKK